MHFDVFNGDADGICALHQLRLAEPLESVLVTGVKRDIALLDGISAGAGDRVTVLDIALGKNRQGLDRALAAGAEVLYFDHHNPGEVPHHPRLTAFIDTSAEVCTSLLVNRYLQDRHLIWAVVAAFGDNLHEAARQAAAPLGLEAHQLDLLRELGECLNYNAYGESVEDLYFHPAELYRLLHRHADPFAFIREEPAFRTLQAGYAADMERARATSPQFEQAAGAIYVLPDMPWSRRVSGVFGNHLASASPQRAHAVLTRHSGGGFVVSVRAPLATKAGADELCRQFDTGGGRKGAAGINNLPDDQLERFVALFDSTFGTSTKA